MIKLHKDHPEKEPLSNFLCQDPEPDKNSKASPPAKARSIRVEGVGFLEGAKP